MSTASLTAIVIFGSGGYARVLADLVEQVGHYRLAGFVDRDARDRQAVGGAPVIAEEAYFADTSFPARGLIGIGDSFVRHTLVQEIERRRPGFEFVTLVHPTAVISRRAEVGQGTALLAGVVVNAGARIGQHVSLFTKALVEHDDVLADFVSLAPAVVLGGDVKIAARSFVGMGAVVKHGVSVGADAVVGAGSVVLRDVEELTAVAGNPAVKIGSRSPGQRYL